jgi:hypothetical protein
VGAWGCLRFVEPNMAADDVVDASSRRPSITGGVGACPLLV